MDSNFLTWNSGIGRLSTGNFLFDLDKKPEVGFDFDSLYYELPWNKFKVLGNNDAVELTENEIKMCEDYCNHYLENDDYFVQTYDDDLIFSGMMTKKEADEKGLKYVIDKIPDHPVSKFMNDEWVRVYATILSNGYYKILPDAICNMCTLFFTEDEWNNFSQPEKPSDIWSFTEEKWIDSRKFEDVYENTLMYIKNYFSTKLSELMDNPTNTEEATWTWQKAEALLYKTDHNSSTPFIDGMLLSIDDKEITKDELANRILKHSSEEYLKSIGEVHGKMYNWILKIRNAKTIEDLDKISDNFNDSIKEESKIKK